uniref:F-box domain-containing protein n=1 Tax=Davidia involucrata TaxID=16924 RepID=A0A5B7CEN8_DAVIN
MDSSSSRRTNQDDDADGGGSGSGSDLHQTNIKRRHFQTQVSRIEPSNSQKPPDLDVGEFHYEFSYLPEWLLLEILVRLPVKSIFRFKCVCKHWLSLISHPSFARSYISRRINGLSPSFRILYRYIYVSDFQEILHRLRPDVYISQNFSVLFLSSFEEQQRADQFKVLASSKGLLLCCLLGPLVYYVCDPVTRQWVCLPRARHNVPTHHPIYFGEGLVSRVNEENVVTSYKVVRVEWLPGESKFINLETFSSETGYWKGLRLFCSQPVRLLMRGGGPFLFNGIMHWFTYEHGMVAFDPYKNAKQCRLIKLPDDRNIESEYKYDGLYRLCNGCQGHLRYFEVAPEASEYFCFSMWVLKDYEEVEWCLEHQVTRCDIWSDDPNLSGSLLHVTFVPLAFHPFSLDVVYLRCVERSCIASYNFQTKQLEVSCHPIGSIEDLSWRVVIPFVLPMWPTPVPQPSRKALKRS